MLHKLENRILHIYMHACIHYITLHYITLRYITLHHITLHTYLPLHTYHYIRTYIYIYTCIMKIDRFWPTSEKNRSLSSPTFLVPPVSRYAGSDHSHTVEKFYRDLGFSAKSLPRQGLVGKGWQEHPPWAVRMSRCYPLLLVDGRNLWWIYGGFMALWMM